MGDARIKLSVIVPVYNTGKYLEKCLNSLAEQTIGEMEVIVVNDGSTDGSQDIIDTFTANYPGRIEALIQENQGPGPARNLGIEHARGEYIGFCDSDDWAEEDMFKMLYDTAIADNSDAAVCDYYDEYEFEYKYKSRIFPGFPAKKGTPLNVPNYICNIASTMYLWNKIIKSEILKKAPFPAGYYEDMAVTPIVLSYCNKISYVKKPLYHYLRRTGSITTNLKDQRNLDVIKSWSRCINEVNPGYKDEMLYAVYFSLTRFLEYKKDCSDAYMEFFYSNETLFKDNAYILEAIASKEVRDLWNPNSAAINKTEAEIKSDEYEKSVTDFLNETAAIFECIDSLPPETLKELLGMYDGVLEMAEENIYNLSPEVPGILRGRRNQIALKIGKDNQ